MARGQMERRSSDTVEVFAYRYHTEWKVRWYAPWLLRRGVARTVSS